MTLRICNFNVLAPSMRICRPLNQVPWQARHRAICNALLTICPHIACLQEFEFHPRIAKEFADLYEEHLGNEYVRYDLRRTGGKPEGLALLLKRDAFDDVRVQNIELMPHYCDRVAQVASMRHVASGHVIRVVNTHLTVPHPSNDADIPQNRPLQMSQVLELLQEGTPSCLFLCADMNSDHLETQNPATGKVDRWGRSGSREFLTSEVSKPVHMAFDAGFQSALHVVHSSSRPISHTSSYAQDGCVDYILFQGASLSLHDAYLHPKDLPIDTTWNEKVGWGTLSTTFSDHRPLFADFQVLPAEEVDKEQNKGIH